MSDKKWTAGPWRALSTRDDSEPDHGYAVLGGGDPHSMGEGLVAYCQRSVFGHEDDSHNANLIAAAPDMFAALEKMVEWHCVRGNTDEDPILDYERQPHEVRQAMDALSKARGES